MSLSIYRISALPGNVYLEWIDVMACKCLFKGIQFENKEWLLTDKCTNDKSVFTLKQCDVGIRIWTDASLFCNGYKGK